MGWFVGFALSHPAYVKTLAQVELPLRFDRFIVFQRKLHPQRNDCMFTIAFGSIIVIWA